MKLRFRYMTRKNKMLFELGIALILVILFFGFLGSLTSINREAIYTLGGNETVYIEYKTSNGTYIRTGTYKLSDIGTLYNGTWYISIPYNADNETVYSVYIKTNITIGELINKGWNGVYFYASIIPDDANITFTQKYITKDLQNYWDNSKAIVTFDVSPNATSYKDIDTGSLIVQTVGYTNNPPIPVVKLPFKRIDGLKIAFTAYAVSTKPVLSAITEPVYSVIATLYTGILAVYRRVKQYASTLFGGFITHFSLTALIGDPVTALLLTVVFLTVVFMVMKKR